MGYVLLFVPVLLSKTNLSRYKFIISFTLTFVLTVLMLLNIRIWRSFMLGRGILMTAYGFLPVILCTIICIFHLDAFLKAGICTAVSAVIFYCTNHVITALFGSSDNHYQVDFSNWEQCINGNIHFIMLISFLFVSAVFVATGIFRIVKNKN